MALDGTGVHQFGTGFPGAVLAGIANGSVCVAVCVCRVTELRRIGCVAASASRVRTDDCQLGAQWIRFASSQMACDADDGHQCDRADFVFTATVDRVVGMRGHDDRGCLAVAAS